LAVLKPLALVKPRERVAGAGVLQELQLVSRGYKVVPQLVLVGAETPMSALLVAIRSAQIADGYLYVRKHDVKGGLVASLIRDRCLQVGELICQRN
jgi:hypothetical protein